VRRKPASIEAYNGLAVILCDDKGDYAGAVAAMREVVRRLPKNAVVHANLGRILYHQGAYQEAAAHLEEAIRLSPKAGFGYGSLAWMLATAADEKFRDPQRALELAQKATALDHRGASHWTGLGVAHYRTGAWKPAVEAIGRGMELSNGGDSNDWFFLGMVKWRLGEKEEARRWYDKAVKWADKNKPNDEGLKRFRHEAAALLKIQAGSQEQ
jgi:tetratricopeptide (TPR) repeat protein